MIISYFITKESRKWKIEDNFGNILLSSNLAEIFDFFLNGNANFRVTWSLYSILEICNDLLPQAAYNELISKDKVEWNEYKIFSSAGRVFSITYHKHNHDNFYDHQECSIFHMAQFFPDFSPKTAVEVADKCQELLNYLDSVNLHPTKLTSAVAIYDECILSRIDLPTIYNMPEDSLDACEYAHRVGIREWAAVYQVGHWDEAYDIDMNGGYPSIMRDLPDTRDMKVWYSKKYCPCDVAFLKGKVNITADFSPIVDSEGVPYKGSKVDYITKDAWAIINLLKLGSFEMEDGFFIKFNTQDKPFHDLMNDLYNARGESGLERLFPKLISTGVYGRLAQEYENRYGDLFNPVLASLTTTRMSLKLGKMLIDNNLQSNVISATIDGALLNTEPNIPTGTKLGDWRVSEPLKTLVMSRGFQWCADKHPNNYYYTDMVNAILAKPNSNLYNGILLNNDLKSNRKFNEFPKNGRQLLENKYRSEAIAV